MDLQNQIPKHVRSIYLMAICGTGMGSLAGLLKQQGFEVCGSDQNVYPPMSDELARQNIPVFSPYSSENLQKAKPDLVIVGNAISKTNAEAAFLLESDTPYVSMPQALKHFFLADKNVIVVAGTHGKTTTTSIMAYLLSELGLEPSFLIGGVSKNFSSNFHIGSGNSFVIEGDEYDTAFFDKGPKFVHYNPKHVILTSLEFDHADIYKDLEHVTSSFKKLTAIIPKDGSLHYCDNYPQICNALQAQSQYATQAYGESSPGWQIVNYTATPTGSCFEIHQNGSLVTSVDSPLSGLYNAQNVAACLSVINAMDLDVQQAVQKLAGFQSVKRRQDIALDQNGIVIVDDFAHHPTAVQKTITAMRQKYPEHHLVAIFEPRSNTSRRDIFQNDYIKSFGDADEVIIAPVNRPEKVQDGHVLNVSHILSELASQGYKTYAPKDTQDIVKATRHIQKRPLCLLVMSNGDFDGLVTKLVHDQSVRS